MTLDDPNQTAADPIDRTKNQPGILCNRCDHLNYGGHDECEDCGAPLFIECVHCGEKVTRVFTRCPHCHHRLRHRGGHGRRHGGKHRRPYSSTQRATRLLLWVIVVVFVLFTVAGFVLLRFQE